MFEDFINAIQNFKTSKTRTILSLLGIIIGVASVIMVTTIGRSATENIKKTFGSSGLDIVQIMGGYGKDAEAIIFNEKLRNELTVIIPEIKNIYFSNDISGELRNGSLNLGLSVKAIESGYLELMQFALDYGRYFSVSENVNGYQKIILGSEIVRFLFPEGNAVGKNIILQQQGIQFGFEVIGVLAKSDSGAFEDSNRIAFIPRGFYTKKITPNPVANGIIVQAKSQNLAPKVRERIKKYAFDRTGSEEAMYVFSMQTMLEQYDKITMSLNLLLSGIAGISLLVGGIGIMNIMIVTVTERKKEIGIRKALGASPADIRNQFLVESATLTLFGGFIGIGIGLLLSYVIVTLFKWPFLIQWTNCIIAFVFSAVVGIFFGLNPALRAAKLDPVDALCGE